MAAAAVPQREERRWRGWPERCLPQCQQQDVQSTLLEGAIPPVATAVCGAARGRHHQAGAGVLPAGLASSVMHGGRHTYQRTDRRLGLCLAHSYQA